MSNVNLTPQFIPYNSNGAIYAAGAGNALSMISLFNSNFGANPTIGSDFLWILFLIMWLILETLYIFMIQYVKCLSCCCKDIERDKMFNGITAAYNDTIQALALYFVNGTWTDPDNWIDSIALLIAPLVSIVQFVISSHTTLMAYYPCNSKCSEKYALPSLIALTEFINLENLDILFAIFSVVFDNHNTCKTVRCILKAINNPDRQVIIQNTRKNRNVKPRSATLYDFVNNLLPILPNHPHTTTIKNAMQTVDINAIKANYAASQQVNTPAVVPVTVPVADVPVADVPVADVPVADVPTQ